MDRRLVVYMSNLRLLCAGPSFSGGGCRTMRTEARYEDGSVCKTPRYRSTAAGNAIARPAGASSSTANDGGMSASRTMLLSRLRNRPKNVRRAFEGCAAAQEEEWS